MTSCPSCCRSALELGCWQTHFWAAWPIIHLAGPPYLHVCRLLTHVNLVRPCSTRVTMFNSQTAVWLSRMCLSVITRTLSPTLHHIALPCTTLDSLALPVKLCHSASQLPAVLHASELYRCSSHGFSQSQQLSCNCFVLQRPWFLTDPAAFLQLVCAAGLQTDCAVGP